MNDKEIHEEKDKETPTHSLLSLNYKDCQSIFNLKHIFYTKWQGFCK
ncbi:hypothetical protein KKH82_02020 [Patescibacteria group bacterium]|nr:hypothetical protein [Patescibacteria group bacterium]